MAKQLTNLSGLGLDRDGVTKRSVKAHMAALQQQIRDLQEEMRTLTGGGRGQVPTTTKTPFQLSAPDAATAIDKLEAKQGLRTGTKSQVRHDLVTKKELEGRVASAASATGFMDLLTDQIVASGNKDFGSISFQATTFTLDVTATYSNANLDGATVWIFTPNAATVTAGPIIERIAAPSTNKGAFRVLIWTGTNSALRLRHMVSTGSGGRQIDTMSAAVNATIQTTGPGAFLLYFWPGPGGSGFGSRWYVVGRAA